MVEFVDGSLKAQLGAPCHAAPISIALCYPDRPGRCSPVPPDHGSKSERPLEFHALERAAFTSGPEGGKPQSPAKGAQQCSMRPTRSR